MHRRAFLSGLGASVVAAGCSSGPTDPVAAPTAAVPAPTPAPTAAPVIVPTLIRSVPGAAGVALTFHMDGDPTLVSELLDVLRDLATPVTAMVVGQWLEANPAFADRLLADGHEVANHTYSHGDMPTMDAVQIRTEIDACAAVLERLTGTRGRWFRPSAVNAPTELMVQVAADAGYEATVGFDVDPLDYRATDAATVTAGVVGVASAGDIVSLHFGYPATVAAVPAMVEGLRARGLEPATVSALVAQAAPA